MTISPKVKAWLVDVGERVGSSFGEAVIAAITAGALAKGINATTAHVLLVAGLTAAAATLKGILAGIVKKDTVSPASLAPAQQPGQAEQDAPPDVAMVDVHDRVRALPKPSGRKGGLLPSPRDDRDYQAKLPAPSKIPASVDNGAGITWGMLLNDRIGDCYEAAGLHALQVLTGYTPVDGDALAIYEQVTAYDPTKTKPDGSNPTDQGTYGRQLYNWMRSNGLIDSYAAVPADRASVKAAIAAHKVVLCEWALPAGAETEGDVWTMPRHNRAAGSWGGHATVEAGYTAKHNRNVTWGEYGTVTPAFEDAYLQAGWTISTSLTATQVAAIMAKVRAT